MRIFRNLSIIRRLKGGNWYKLENVSKGFSNWFTEKEYNSILKLSHLISVKVDKIEY